MTSVPAQCTSALDIYQKLESLDGNGTFKLQKARELQQEFERCGFEKDSVYVRLLDRIGLYFYLIDENDISNAIQWGYKATAASKDVKAKSNFVSAKAYLNLGLYLNEANENVRAVAMLDTVSRLYLKSDGRMNAVCANALIKSVYLLNNLGEYKQCVDKASSAISQIISGNDSSYLAKMYAIRGLANSKLKQLESAEHDASLALSVIEDRGGFKKNTESYLNAMFVKAKVAIEASNFSKADKIFLEALQKCRELGISNDDVYSFYTEYGNYLSNQKQNFQTSIVWYLKCVDSDKPANKATAYLNISQNYWRLKQYDNAERYFKLARGVQHPNENVQNIYTGISANKWNIISNKDQLIVTINNNLELLLTRFKLSTQAKYLAAAKSIAKAGDSVLSLLRREQLEEVSKLYWRDRTREFYRHALEAAYLLHDNDLAFYFMEKSRAVILNDQLHTVQATNLLPIAKVNYEQKLRIEIIKFSNAINKPGLTDMQYKEIEKGLLAAKDSFRLFTKSLERDYPDYYKIKYADQVPTLAELQGYLKANQQSFVHYFMADTVAYVMAITPVDVVVKKISQPQYNPEVIVDFLKLCSQPALLNANYRKYQELSAQIYETYLQPLRIAKGRVIICPDSYLLPFEAIILNGKPNRFLLNDYAFSYVYAARNLLMNFPLRKSEGNFLGIAPISFANNLKMPQLKESGNAVQSSGTFYASTHMIVGKEATKSSFLNSIGNYEVVNVYSHALSDSTIAEPAIYMCDSVIYLSELQLINDISAQLVLLSACQTSVGKNATGEGIYSLARGLAAVGIPSVAATLWEADEASIYAITEKFNEGISKGMAKDVALQQAKLWFLNSSNAEKKLAPYWANMIIIGNASPIVFSKHVNWSHIAIIAGGVILILVAIFFLYRQRKGKKSEKQHGMNG